MTGIINKFNKLNVLIIGDVMVDSYVWGSINRMSPEAPVPVIRVSKKEDRLGGAANVALNVRSLGANAIMCATIGDDAAGLTFSSLLKNAGLTGIGIVTTEGRPTTVKTRIIAHDKHVARVDDETDTLINTDERSLILQKIHELLGSQQIDVIIFEDYDKGLISQELISEVVSQANHQGIVTVVDPKKRNFHFYERVTLFKPNLKELREGLERDIDPSDMKSLESAVDLIKGQLNAGIVMLTLSEHGVFVKGGNASKLFPAHPRLIADVSGAGDTVIATAALCLAAGLDEYDTARVSNLAGGLVCEHVGVVPIDRDQLATEVEKLCL